VERTGWIIVVWEWLAGGQRADLGVVMDIAVQFKVIKSDFGQHKCSLSEIEELSDGVVYHYDVLAGSDNL